MEARGNRSRNGDGDIDRGQGGARKHTPGDHGESGASKSRKADKQDNIRAKNATAQQAQEQATAELENLKATKSDSVMKMILGGKTEEQWIRQRQLEIMNGD